MSPFGGARVRLSPLRGGGRRGVGVCGRKERKRPHARARLHPAIACARVIDRPRACRRARASSSIACLGGGGSRVSDLLRMDVRNTRRAGAERARRPTPRALRGPHGQELVGCRVSVYWSDELPPQWFHGTVKSFDVVTGWHIVSYDDGDQRQEPLNDNALNWRVAQLHSPHSRKRGRPRCSKPGPCSAAAQAADSLSATSSARAPSWTTLGGESNAETPSLLPPAERPPRNQLFYRRRGRARSVKTLPASLKPGLGLRRAATDRVGAACQVHDLPALHVQTSLLPPPAPPPLCRCGLPATWARARWWCAADLVGGAAGCGYEAIPPPVHAWRTPLCDCARPAVWRYGHWWCDAATTGRGCSFQRAEDPARPEPLLVEPAAVEDAMACCTAVQLTSAAYAYRDGEAGGADVIEVRSTSAMCASPRAAQLPSAGAAASAFAKAAAPPSPMPAAQPRAPGPAHVQSEPGPSAPQAPAPACAASSRLSGVAHADGPVGVPGTLEAEHIPSAAAPSGQKIFQCRVPWAAWMRVGMRLSAQVTSLRKRAKFSVPQLQNATSTAFKVRLALPFNAEDRVTLTDLRVLPQAPRAGAALASGATTGSAAVSRPRSVREAKRDSATAGASSSATEPLTPRL